MKTYLLKIKSIRHITHDVLKLIREKPQHYNHGQAAEMMKTILKQLVNLQGKKQSIIKEAF